MKPGAIHRPVWDPISPRAPACLATFRAAPQDIGAPGVHVPWLGGSSAFLGGSIPRRDLREA
jgi:hypothetical protein